MVELLRRHRLSRICLLINVLALHKKPLILKPTRSFMFKGVQLLYSRYILKDKHYKMKICRTYPECT
jgi:hypothetical protein